MGPDTPLTTSLVSHYQHNDFKEYIEDRHRSSTDNLNFADYTITFAAAQWQYRKLSFASRATATRIIYDKLLIGRNRRKIGLQEGYDQTIVSLLQRCPFCNHHLEDASHWILHCPPFQHIRDDTIHQAHAEIHKQTSNVMLLRRFISLATTSSEGHHLWIGTWTSTLIAEFTLAITTPTDHRILRKQLLTLGHILTQGILNISRARGTTPPTIRFTTDIALYPQLHTLYPLHLLQMTALRAQLRKRHRSTYTHTSRLTKFPGRQNYGSPVHSTLTSYWPSNTTRRSLQHPRTGIG